VIVMVVNLDYIDITEWTLLPLRANSHVRYRCHRIEIYTPLGFDENRLFKKYAVLL
jgi:hypothetical protein